MCKRNQPQCQRRQRIEQAAPTPPSLGCRHVQALPRPRHHAGLTFRQGHKRGTTEGRHSPSAGRRGSAARNIASSGACRQGSPALVAIPESPPDLRASTSALFAARSANRSASRSAGGSAVASQSRRRPRSRRPTQRQRRGSGPAIRRRRSYRPPPSRAGRNRVFLPRWSFPCI